jgi:hypothetical protein
MKREMSSPTGYLQETPRERIAHFVRSGQNRIALWDGLYWGISAAAVVGLILIGAYVLSPWIGVPVTVLFIVSFVHSLRKLERRWRSEDESRFEKKA